MNLSKYDLPFQQPAHTIHQSQLSFDQECSPIFLKTPYDLPQKINSHFENKESQKGSIFIKSLFTQCSFPSNHEDSRQNANMKNKEASVYEKILMDEKSKTKTINTPFRQRKANSDIMSWKKETKNKSLSSRKSLQKSLSKKVKVDIREQSQPKTKYEAILQNHFKNKKIKSTQIKTNEQMRISNIFGKNEKILEENRKLKEKYESIRSEKRINTEQQAKKVEKKIQKPKRCNSQHWMEMNFHQRQQKVIQNRQRKEQQGRKENIEKEIRPCTFKPNLSNKMKSSKVMAQEKQTYLKIYNDRLNKRF